jgi:hypothetical protein
MGQFGVYDVGVSMENSSTNSSSRVCTFTTTKEPVDIFMRKDKAEQQQQQSLIMLKKKIDLILVILFSSFSLFSFLHDGGRRLGCDRFLIQTEIVI